MERYIEYDLCTIPYGTRSTKKKSVSSPSRGSLADGLKLEPAATHADTLPQNQMG